MEEEITVEMENNPSRPERTLRPIVYASWFLGVGVARPSKCPKPITVILRLFHFGVCTVIVAFSAMDFANFGKEFTSKLFEIMYCMNETVCHVSSYYYVYHVMRHYDKWPELMRMMESLDDHIGKELPINDNGVKIRQILAILTVCLFGPVSLTVHVLYYFFTDPEQIFASDLLLYYTIAQTLANSFVYDIVVYMICLRFRTINETIKGLDERSGAYWAALKIRRIRKLHNEACTVIMTVNDIYGVDMLLCSTNSFIMVVAKLFRIYMSAAEQKNGFIFLNNVIWMIYGWQFIVMCWVCTLTHREINKIGPYIGEFVLNAQHSTKFNKMAAFRKFRYKGGTPLNICEDQSAMNLNGFGMESLLRTNFERDCVRNEANDFSLQLQQHRVKFTACDFFEMDNSLLTRFISVITTYLIILVQFYKPDGL
ncbi:PREDICTED: uncharacterized protein LOC107191147 [Dufourea novaeangliae]|uniref:uncharacterized protein LOC107191147 n=1 Tax=Dufourea novaeangliae TaxID=178035 RepID=UPI0007678793|nr:PREDICTED: uncharacterized protein LOC107191147 [Dufourea novaeangliae]